MADARCDECGAVGARVLCAACRRLEPDPVVQSPRELRAEERQIERLAAKIQRALIAARRCPEPRRCARTIAITLLGTWPKDADPVRLIQTVAGIDRVRAQTVYLNLVRGLSCRPNSSTI